MREQRQNFIKIWKYLKSYRVLLLFSMGLSVIIVGLTLCVPVQIGKGIDYIIGAGNVDFKSIRGILKVIAIIVVVTAILTLLMNYINNKVTYQVVRDIRKEAFGKIETLPLKYLDSHAYGEIVSKVIADVDQFADGLLLGFTQLFTGVSTIVFTLLFMLFENFKITIVVVVLTPISLVVANYIAKKTYTMFQLQSQIRGEQTGFIEEMISNQKVVQSFTYEEHALRRFGQMNDQLEKASRKAIFYSSLTNPSTRFVNSLVYAAVLAFGAIATINGGLTIGALSCFLSYAKQYTKPFNEISGVVAEFQNALACGNRIFDFIAVQSEEDEGSNPFDGQEISGVVDLKAVEFSYTTEKPLIQNLNLHVPAGQRVAIVGPTGCGKTTVINLLMRFYELNGGQISIDGQNIAKISRKNIRQQYGMVLQETWLKSGTILENIIMGKEDASFEEVVEAAKACHAHGFIKRLENGYDTYIGEDGGNLSQGQKQLLCIARIMLSIPPMLILDEATSSIDTRTEQKIQAAFFKMMKGRTSFIVAHRLSTIMTADVILVMNEGSIIEMGNHEELLAKGGFYANLFESQFAKVNENN